MRLNRSDMESLAASSGQGGVTSGMLALAWSIIHYPEDAQMASRALAKLTIDASERAQRPSRARR